MILDLGFNFSRSGLPSLAEHCPRALPIVSSFRLFATEEKNAVLVVVVELSRMQRKGNREEPSMLGEDFLRKHK